MPESLITTILNGAGTKIGMKILRNYSWLCAIFSVEPGIEPSDLHMPAKSLTTEPYPGPIIATCAGEEEIRSRDVEGRKPASSTGHSAAMMLPSPPGQLIAAQLPMGLVDGWAPENEPEVGY